MQSRSVKRTDGRSWTSLMQLFTGSKAAGRVRMTLCNECGATNEPLRRSCSRCKGHLDERAVVWAALAS